jgi:hypothetical protein
MDFVALLLGNGVLLLSAAMNWTAWTCSHRVSSA